MNIQALYEVYLRHPHVTTDSRQVRAGSLFFALRGERFDGNQFAQQALADGAVFAVVDDPSVALDSRFILVDNTLNALQELARHHRRQFDIPVVGITGSNGKTTTKELASIVLGSHYRLHFTQGNLNNHIGVPLTLLAMPLGVEVAVIEMGANHQGEIDLLSRIAEPSHGLITNIGKAHLEGFGGIEGVKKGKSELYRYLAETGGVAFVNLDEPFLEELAAPVNKKVLYHRSDKPDPLNNPYEAVLISTHPVVETAFLNEAGKLITVKSKLAGRHNFNNIMTAITIGKYFKAPCERIKTAIEAYVPSNNRSQLMAFGPHTLYLDAYNANPTSMREALNSFNAMAGDRKVAILGDMLELGEAADEEHRLIGELAVSLHFDDLVLIGPRFAKVAGELGLRHFEDAEQCRQWFAGADLPPSLILLKGSRGIGLEKIFRRD